MAGSVFSGPTDLHHELPAGLTVVAKAGQAGAIDFELTSTVRRIFLTPASGVRSVLFCAVPGEEMGDTATEAAQALAAQSGQQVAYIEYTARQLVLERTRIPDLFTSYSFVIVSATASSVDDLIPLAQDVDGVIVGITKDRTRIDTAHELVTTLRKARANLLGAIYISESVQSD
jgi:hypothetical protein